MWSTLDRLIVHFLEQTLNVAINQLQPSVAFHIETSQLILIANQLNGFYLTGTLVENGFKRTLK